MFLRRTRVKHGDKQVEYIQLVESYRRPQDGRPAHRVLANLGRLSEEQFQNFRLALEASRKGQQVVVARRLRKDDRPPKPEQNLRYLDLAVLLSLWRQSGLEPLVKKLLDDTQQQASAADVVAALAFQRCIDPGSKLESTRWFPTTALPELLALSPDLYNNTRVHRVLDLLESATPALMEQMPRLAREPGERFASLFLDVSDASFEGHGPALAELGETKDGRYARKIGIVLLCSEHGYPLRWEVVAGNRHDSQSMGQMLWSVAGLDWIQGTPVVVDRAMGRSAQLSQMLRAGVYFVTALARTEFDAYAQDLPWEPLADLATAELSEQARSEATEEAGRRALEAGMERVSETMYVLDQGLVLRQSARARRDQQPSPQDDQAPTEPEPEPDGCARAMALCRQINRLVDQGCFPTFNAAGRSLGLARGPVTKYRKLGKLPEDIQKDIVMGRARGASLAQVIKVARLPSDAEQRQAFASLVAVSPWAAPAGRRHRRPAQAGPQEAELPPLRSVVYFNPQLFVDCRLRAQQKLSCIEQFVEQLNQKLCTGRSHRSRDGVVAAIDRELRHHGLLDAFRVVVTEQQGADRVMFRAQLELDHEQWQRRRRFDGFVVLIAHPDLSLSAAALSQLYRAKDAVEKDFHIIKSVVGLRPVRHQTEPKVRAHVTICMLALFLERHLRRLLRGQWSAEQALALLGTCHLNRYAASPSAGPSSSVYTVTEPDPDQTAVLKKLRLGHLCDDDHIAGVLCPR